MAGEVTHVVYAARLLTYLKDAVTDPAYWVGTLFPDIRHLGVVSRHDTHARDVTLTSLVGPTDFHTGMRVHAWVDATREKFLRDALIKERLPWHPFVPFSLNLFEDELLYSYFDDWNLIMRLLGQRRPEAAAYCAESSINQWHAILHEYLKAPPTASRRRQLAQAIGLSEAMADEANTVVERLRADGRAVRLLEQLWQHLENLLR